MKASRRVLPLLTILWPLIGGILATRYWPEIVWICPTIAGGFLLALGLFSKNHFRALLYPLAWTCIYIGLFGLAWGYAALRADPPPLHTWAPQREATLSVTLNRLFNPAKGETEQLRALATITDAAPHLAYLKGQSIALSLKNTGPSPLSGSSGVVKGLLSSTTTPSQNAFQHYLATSGIPYELRRGNWVTTTAEAPLEAQFYTKTATTLETILRSNSINESWADIYVAMLLGKTAVLSPEQKIAFASSGTLHLFAISGLHIAVISALLFASLKRLPLPTWFIALLGLSILFIYIEATGGAPSARRAFLMVAFMWGGQALNREASAFAGLLAAATLSLLYEPALLYHAGFQLSYMVVAALLLYGLPLGAYLKERYPLWPLLPEANRQEVLRRWVIWSWHKLLEAFCLSLSATLISTPLIIGYFKLFSPIALPLNLPLIPLSSAVIVLGFISLSTGLIGLSFIPTCLNPIAEGLLGCMATLVNVTLKIPLSHLSAEWQLPGLGPLLALGLLTYFIYGPTPSIDRPKPFWIPLVLLCGSLLSNQI